MTDPDELVEAFARLLPEGDLVGGLDVQLQTTREILARVAEPDVEIALVGPGGFAAVFRGVDGFEEGWRDWLEPFATYRMEVEPDVRRGEDALVFFARQIATPKGTEASVSTEAAAVAFLAGGKIRRLEFHLDREAALRSAGLAG